MTVTAHSAKGGTHTGGQLAKTGVTVKLVVVVRNILAL